MIIIQNHPPHHNLESKTTLTVPHLANGPWNKSLNFIFNKYVIPKSLSPLAIGQVRSPSREPQYPRDKGAGELPAPVSANLRAAIVVSGDSRAATVAIIATPNKHDFTSGC